MHLSCYWQWILSLNCQSSLWIHSAIAPVDPLLFDNVMTRFMIKTGWRCIRADTEFVILEQLQLRKFGKYGKKEEFYFWAVSINCSTAEWDLCPLIRFQRVCLVGETLKSVSHKLSPPKPCLSLLWLVVIMFRKKIVIMVCKKYIRSVTIMVNLLKCI